MAIGTNMVAGKAIIAARLTITAFYNRPLATKTARAALLSSTVAAAARIVA